MRSRNVRIKQPFTLQGRNPFSVIQYRYIISLRVTKVHRMDETRGPKAPTLTWGSTSIMACKTLLYSNVLSCIFENLNVNLYSVILWYIFDYSRFSKRFTRQSQCIFTMLLLSSFGIGHGPLQLAGELFTPSPTILMVEIGSYSGSGKMSLL